MFLKDPVTGQPSLPFMMYVLDCEGEFDKDKEKEEADDSETDGLDE